MFKVTCELHRIDPATYTEGECRPGAEVSDGTRTQTLRTLFISEEPSISNLMKLAEATDMHSPLHSGFVERVVVTVYRVSE